MIQFLAAGFSPVSTGRSVALDIQRDRDRRPRTGNLSRHADSSGCLHGGSILDPSLMGSSSPRLTLSDLGPAAQLRLTLCFQRG
jgi:hypothetical protein